MRLNSLAFRLFAAAAALALIVLPAAAIVLVSLYRGAVERNFDARLGVYLTNLIAASIAAEQTVPKRPPDLGEAAFTIPFSGWYWQIRLLDGASRPLFTSSSLLDESLPLPSEAGAESDTDRVRKAYVSGPESQQLRVIEREITLASAQGQPRYSYAVAGNSDAMEKDITQFTTMLISALTVLGVGLVIATLFQVRFGLRPIRTMQRGLAAIRSGEATSLEGELPAEIEPLQDELNALIHSNQAIVERARTHVGNLAHALKTPLSVITNEARGKRSPLARLVVDQSEVMRNQITHHLDRARMAARSGVIHGLTEIEPVLGSLQRALERIYEERGLTITVTCPEGIRFQGEKHDFEEMVGNLLDNACKWARRGVALKVVRKDITPQGRGRRMVIFVDDDGPGLTQSKREEAMRRGQRMDETKPGSGLGLSIVADLAHVYKGTFKLKVAPLGGLRARLELPAA